MATSDVKLALLKQIREEQNANALRIQSRENILYGHGRKIPRGKTGGTFRGSFLLRTLAVTLLVAGCYQATVQSEKITQTVQQWLLREDITMDETSLTGLIEAFKMDTEQVTESETYEQTGIK